VDLSQYAVQDMIPKTVSALDAGTPPDVAYADVYDFQVAGKWAFDGKLEDISGIIEPMKARLPRNTVETTFLYNDKPRRSYYAFPLKQQTMHIQYWATCCRMPATRTATSPRPGRNTGRSGATRRKVDLRKKTGKRGLRIGIAHGCRFLGPFYSFLTFMDAYNVKLVDDDGKLLVDDPKVSRG